MVLTRCFVSLSPDDKTELFNPDCRNCLLLNNIKERCDCDDDGEHLLTFFFVQFNSRSEIVNPQLRQNPKNDGKIIRCKN